MVSIGVFEEKHFQQKIRSVDKTRCKTEELVVIIKLSEEIIKKGLVKHNS